MRSLLLAAAVAAAGCGLKDASETRAAARRDALEREADDWARKGTVLQHEIGTFQAFTQEYRREFGYSWDATAAEKEAAAKRKK